MSSTRYKQALISSPSFRKRNKCKATKCKSIRYLSIYDEEDKLRHCLIHLIDNLDSIDLLPEDAREEIDEILSEESHVKFLIIEALREQKKRAEIKRLNILSDALNDNYDF